MDLITILLLIVGIAISLFLCLCGVLFVYTVITARSRAARQRSSPDETGDGNDDTRTPESR